MPPASFLIKPASSNCNLRCKYCFYHSIAENRDISSYGIMSFQTLEILIEKALQYSDGSCTFAFQGGEPTLAGLEYFSKFIELVKKHNKKNVQINYALQTNGVVIDELWASFLAENKFLVGISLDGPKDIHDLTRIDSLGKGSYTRVLNTITLFNKYKVEYNILCVVNSYIAGHASKVYNFFKRSGFRYLQFIPCLDPLNEEPGKHDYSLLPDKYALFLKNLFDQWYSDIIKGNMISIRYFDNLVGMLIGHPPESCGMSGLCTAYFVVEANGGVYPCDFYVTDDWYMGNILETDFAQIRNSGKSKEFTEVSKHIDPTCKECKWGQLCRGGCRRNREPFQTNGQPSLNYYCSSFKEFFDYSGDRLIKLAKMFSNNS